MSEIKDLGQSLANLDAWLDSWKDRQNGIHGYVVHHHMDALNVISPDTWTQSAAILGHLNLFKKTGQKKWLEKAASEADYLVESYLWAQSIFKNSVFEHKPGSFEVQASLIHNAYPSYALLKLCKVLKQEKKAFKKYFKIAKDNVENFIIRQCWDDENKVLHRNVQEKGKHFVLNMASTGLRALLYLDELEPKNRIERYCIPLAEKIISLQESNGAFPYTDEKKLSPLIYVAITMQGLLSLYKRIKKDDYLVACKQAALFLVQNIDPETKLFYHRFEGKQLKKFPEFIAGSMVIVHQIERLAEFGIHFKQGDEVMQAVLKKQYQNGALPNFIGFSDVFMQKFYPPEPEKKKWRDVIAVPGWNALAFDALTYCLPEKAALPKPRIKFPVTYASDEYKIVEGRKEVRFFDKQNKVVAKWFKEKDSCEFCFIPLRSGEERLKHSLFVWKKRLKPIKPLLDLIYPFRISEKKG